MTTATRPNDIWPHALEELRLQMPKTTFDTWLKGTTAQLQDDTLTVVVANSFAQDWLKHRLRPKIEGSVASIAGRPLEIAFTVRSNGHLETNELLPAEDSITYEVEHYEIWAPADPTVLRILPGLAEEIGLNQSIVLLQLDYWIRHSDNVRDGRRWTYQSLRGMRKKAFKWWSKDTIGRAITSLQAQQLIFVTDEYNQNRLNHTRWFAIDPVGFRQLQSIELKQAQYEIWAPADPAVLRIMPDLAKEIGFNASIVLLQLSYWIRHSDNVRDGKRWTFQSVRDMQHKAFKWWSLDTINRTIASLVAQHLIFATDEHNRHKYDRTRWFALNPHGFRKLESIKLKRLP